MAAAAAIPALPPAPPLVAATARTLVLAPFSFGLGHLALLADAQLTTGDALSSVLRTLRSHAEAL
jgi:hypothetical protein